MIRRIPLFPLPGVVLFPGTLLPLHIFEPRYRAMVADALRGDRTIGMALLRPGADPLAAEPPPVEPIGGAGDIVDHEKLEDGRYNLVLEGRFRYRILEETVPAPYRVARVRELPSVPFTEEAAREQAERRARRLFEEVAGPMSLPPLPAAASTEQLAWELALRLRYPPEELHALLALDSVEARFRRLLARLRGWKRRIQFLGPFRPSEIEPGRN